MQNGCRTFLAIIFLLCFITRSCVTTDEWIIPNIKDDIETRRIVCSVSPDRGEKCGPPVIRWYFESRKQICRTFEYNGCKGNSNNFPTQDFCNSYCNRACPYDARPLRREDGGIKICDSQQTCPSDYNCTEVTVENMKMHYCCPTKFAICNQMPSIGEKCAEDSTRWHFNPNQKTCSRFTYKGCNGNSNNFNTTSDCLEFCQSTACLPGERAFRSRSVIQSCAPDKGNSSCSAGFTCRKDELYRRNICCGSQPRVCPEDSKPYVESGTSAELRFCEVGSSDACPSPYICAPNLDERVNYCCSPSSDNGFCYEGQKVYRSEVTSLPKVCRLHISGDCPNDFTCTPMYEFAIEGYCCSGKPSNSPDYEFNSILDDQIFDNDTFGFKNTSKDANDNSSNIMNYISLMQTNFSQITNKTAVGSQMILQSSSYMMNETLSVAQFDQIFDNDTFGLKNISKEVVDYSRDVTNTSMLQSSFTQTNQTANSAQIRIQNSSNVRNEVISVARTVTNSSSQLANSGKEAFVNLITECENDSSCPVGYVCQRNSTTKRSTCLLISLVSANDFVSASEKFETEKTSIFMSTKNITEFTKMNVTKPPSSPSMAKVNQTCITDNDCSMNSSCARTSGSENICVREEQLKNVTKCSDVKSSQLMSNASANLIFCSLEKPCPEPFQCSTVDQFSVCCGPF